MSNQRGFINLFILIPIVVAATVVATFSVPKIIEKNRTANIARQIEQREREVEKLQNVRTSSQEQAKAANSVSQELTELKKQLQELKSSQNKTATQTLRPTPVQSTPVFNNNLIIELSSSRNSLPANGESVAFITATVKDKNGNQADSFSGQMVFYSTAGNLMPSVITVKNGTGFTELQSSTSPTNLTVTAKSGDIESNNINLSFTSVANNTPQQAQELPIGSEDIKAVPQLHCRDGKLVHLGSGVIFTQDGYLLTNHHVAGNSTDCEVWIAFDDKQSPGHVYTAYMVASDKDLDVAVLKINRDAYGNILQNRNFNFLRQSSDKVLVGQSIKSIGFPTIGIRHSYHNKGDY